MYIAKNKSKVTSDPRKWERQFKWEGPHAGVFVNYPQYRTNPFTVREAKEIIGLSDSLIKKLLSCKPGRQVYLGGGYHVHNQTHVRSVEAHYIPQIANGQAILVATEEEIEKLNIEIEAKVGELLKEKSELVKYKNKLEKLLKEAIVLDDRGRYVRGTLLNGIEKTCQANIK